MIFEQSFQLVVFFATFFLHLSVCVCASLSVCTNTHTHTYIHSLYFCYDSRVVCFFLARSAQPSLGFDSKRIAFACKIHG